MVSFLLLSKIFSIQVVSHNKYENILNQETVMVKNEQGARGKIYDLNGISLADNITKIDFWVNTSEDFDKEAIVSIFSKAFKRNPQYYLDILSNKGHYIEIEKNIEEIYCKDILNSIYDLKGLRYSSSEKRFYPYDNLTSTIIGFFNKEDGSSSGVENYFDGVLSGKEFAVEHQIFNKVSTRIELPCGTKKYAKEILKDPERYFTKDILDEIDEACQKEFLYGSAMKEDEDVDSGTSD